MLSSSLSCVLAMLLAPPAPVFAQDETTALVALIAAAPPEAGAKAPQPEVFRAADSDAKRPAALLPLYASLSALNVLDVHSTLSGIANGRVREANPVMEPFANNQGAFIALKAGTTATAILMTESIRKKHPKRAVIVMIAANAAMAAIVANNYRALHR